MLSGGTDGKHYFYVGIGGSGMSALAQYQAMSGDIVSGSDREWNKEIVGEKYRHFANMGISLYSQDGTGIKDGITSVVKSTAVENDNPDIKVAIEKNIPVIHRSDVLASFVNGSRSIAVAGTSGKSTVTAMIFDLLNGIAASPSVITGGDLESLRKQGYQGNAYAGKSGLLVVEADESDGTLVEYRPHVGLILNVEKDHKEISELIPLFEKFTNQSAIKVVNRDDERCAPFWKGAVTFGVSNDANYKITDVVLSMRSVSFSLNGISFTIPWPGFHTVMNGAAALVACASLGYSLEELKLPLSTFAGVSRRFQSRGVKSGVEVIDDYAHNPAKLEAAIKAAQGFSKRVLAVFQPHGYGPARFMRYDYVDAFAKVMRENDILYMPEIYYAGGTVKRDISSADIVSDAKSKGVNAVFVAQREELGSLLCKEAVSGDTILVMGARDSTLTAFADHIVRSI